MFVCLRTPPFRILHVATTIVIITAVMILFKNSIKKQNHSVNM